MIVGARFFRGVPGGFAAGASLGYGYSGGSSLPDVVYRSSDGDATDSTVFTFTGQSIGPADERDAVIVGVVARDTSNDNSVASMTIGGQAATLISAYTPNDGGNSYTVEFWYATGVTGTTATVAVTMSEEAIRCGIVTWSASNIPSWIPEDSATHAAASSAANYSLDLTTTGTGVILALASHPDGGTTWLDDMAGFEDADFIVEGQIDVSAASRQAVAGSYSITVDQAALAGVQAGHSIALTNAIPPNAMLDADGNPMLDADGNYILNP